MKNNNKWLIGGLIGFTAILLTTAVVLFFQLKQPAPTPSPTPKPRPTTSPQLPQVQETTTEEVCSLSFTVGASPSPSPSPNPSPSPSPSPSPQPITCFDTCSSDAECEADLRCQSVSGTKRCVNPSCSEDADCSCAVAEVAHPSPLASLPKASPPALPQAGVNTPMVLGVSVGILMMLVGLLAL